MKKTFFCLTLFFILLQSVGSVYAQSACGTYNACVYAGTSDNMIQYSDTEVSSVAGGDGKCHFWVKNININVNLKDITTQTTISPNQTSSEITLSSGASYYIMIESPYTTAVKMNCLAPTATPEPTSTPMPTFTSMPTATLVIRFTNTPVVPVPAESDAEPEYVHTYPIDENGAYYITADGAKEYINYLSYSICMKFMGSESACAGYIH